jgi:hypothetical protein
LQGHDIYVPNRVQPEDFDWQNSRPSKPWFAGPRVARRHAPECQWERLKGEERDTALIELRAESLRSTIAEATGRFDKPIWQIRELLGLLINPDQARFGLVINDLRAAVRYKPGRDVATAVLRKLQRGLLAAYEADKLLAETHWFIKRCGIWLPRLIFGF